MSRIVDPLFDDLTLLQIAAADVSVARARLAWDMLVARHTSTHVLVESLDDGPCQRLFPLLGRRADDLDLDAHVQDRCNAETDVAWGLNVRLFDVIGTTLDHWREVEVTPIALKGLALLGDVYDEHQLRHVGDADLLIDKSQVDRCLVVLDRDGWSVPWRAVDRLRFGATALGIAHPTGVGLDLHLRPARNLPYQKPPAHWTTEPVPSNHPLHSTGLIRLTADAQMLTLCAHNTRPENARLAHPLVDLYRQVMFVSRNDHLAYDDLLRLSRQFHFEFRTLDVLSRLRHVFDPAPFGTFAHVLPERQPSAAEKPAIEAEDRRAARLRGTPGRAGRFGAMIGRMRDEVAVTTVGQPRSRRVTQIASYVWQKFLLVCDEQRRWRRR